VDLEEAGSVAAEGTSSPAVQQAANGHKQPAITVAGLTKNYGEIEAVRGIDFRGAGGGDVRFRARTAPVDHDQDAARAGAAHIGVGARRGPRGTSGRDAVRRNIGLVFQTQPSTTT
jgi:hypothetical protein